jgi:hypothetical protein
MRFLFGAAISVVLGWALVARMPARGQETPPEGPAVIQSGDRLPSMITVEHHGRLLVLNYGSKPGSGALRASPAPRNEPPGFVVYKGERPIASGSFEFG